VAFTVESPTANRASLPGALPPWSTTSIEPMSTHWPPASVATTSMLKPDGGSTRPSRRLESMPLTVTAIWGAVMSFAVPVRKRDVWSCANQLPLARRAPALPPTTRMR
jgi:hypothetical protein